MIKDLLNTKAKFDLYLVATKRGFTDWHAIREYAYNHKKYDNLTFRDLDDVHKAIEITY